MPYDRETGDNELARLRAENGELKRTLAELNARGTGGAICESEARFRSVVGSMNEGVVVQDAYGAILACNGMAERILGLTREQLMGRNSLDPCCRAIKENGLPFLAHEHPALVTLRTGISCRNVIMGLVKADGHVTWIDINSEPVPAVDAQGAAVVCTFTDVTAYRQTTQQLRASEERTRVALEAAHMGTWQYEPASGVVSMCVRAQEMFGLAPGAFGQTLDAYAECIHPDDRGSMNATLMRVLAADGAVDSFHAVHRTTRRPEERWIECYGRVWRNTQGVVVRMAGTAIDVTDQRRLEEHLVRGQRLEAVGRLAGGIAHDFNNVLTAIVGSADLCLLAPKQLHEHVGLIQESAARAARLVQQLLMFSKRQTVEPKVLDLSRVVMGLEALLRRLAGERIELAFVIAAEGHRVRADQGQLEQVLMNLVVNARDALPRGGRIQIGIVGAKKSGREVVSLSVRDDGIGMAREVVERAFDPFFTTKDSGTGLGLATCYDIVEQLGGTISIDSDESKGTLVCVELPRSHAPLSLAGSVAKKALKKGSETILLVDDDALVRSVARDLLASSGYHVLCAEDGKQALDKARAYERPIDLLLTDIAMPKMSGVELAQLIARSRPGTAVLLTSGYGGDALDREEGEAARARPFLAKPFTQHELLARVREVLDCCEQPASAGLREVRATPAPLRHEGAGAAGR